MLEWKKGRTVDNRRRIGLGAGCGRTDLHDGEEEDGGHEFKLHCCLSGLG